MILKVGSIYAGAVDAFGYAVNQLNKPAQKFELSWQIEKERKAQKYLAKHHPNTKRYYYDEWFEQYNLEHVHILCGGDPCQPNSNAGLQLGEADDRFRWPFMLSLCKALRPSWIINENVTGSIGNMVLDKKITDLEKIGYQTQSFNIPAVACNAWHERKRIFLIAYANVQRRRELVCANYGDIFETCRPPIALGTCGNAFLQFSESMGEPALFPVDDGLPDHIFRLGAAGNSIYAAIPIILLNAIYEVEKIVNQ
ncbi:DNA cytosine methyltransferase [Pinibacter soli]|uniref:DNA (cytosine-5-)-methyltransferase n=1 Tax=Pinibacter soli TaxID=3044211 RepID=A0ABT6R9C1_9BACT|nr:DNA cytosine methyltransferase [Pinibacter soli]MDI3319150.1 DNA cytosine methyltransferase [Pinibacter soli]